MPDKISVKFAHPHGQYAVGDTAELDEDEGLRVLNSGHAVVATKPEAKKLGMDPSKAATAK